MQIAALNQLVIFGGETTAQEDLSRDKTSLKKITSIVRDVMIAAEKNHSLFRDQYRLTHESTPATRNAHRLWVENAIRNTKKGIEKLSTPISTYLRSWDGCIQRNQASLIGRIMNIFINMYLHSYRSVQAKLEHYSTELDRQILPKFEYFTKEDCIDLLNQNGFAEVPEKEELAKFIAEYKLCLDSDQNLESNEDIQAFNQAIRAYLGQKPGYSVAEVIHNIPTISDKIFSRETYQDLLHSAQMVKHINTEQEAKDLLTSYGFQSYLSIEQFNLLAATLSEKGLYLSSEEGEVALKVNQKFFADFINSYVCKNRDELGPINNVTIEQFFRYPGMHFAQYLQQFNLSESYQNNPFNNHRANCLLRNYRLLRSDHECSTKLAQYLMAHPLKIQNYAHLASDDEKKAFNELALNFLQSLYAKSDERIESAITSYKLLSANEAPRVLTEAREKWLIKWTQLEENYKEKTDIISIADLTEAYELCLRIQTCPEANPIQETIPATIQTTATNIENRARIVEQNVETYARGAIATFRAFRKFVQTGTV